MSPLIDISHDGHIHTRLCNHAHGEMEEYVLAAIDRGLATMSFLEHLETAIDYGQRSWLEEDDFVYYFQEGQRLKERYGDRISIELGVEAGYNSAAADSLRRKLDRFPWDRIGISCHFYPGREGHLNLLSRRRQTLDQVAAIGIDRIVYSYFAALIEAVRTIDCQVLCHLDAVLRHYPGISLSPEHREQIEQLLLAMKGRGIALEINTSGFDYRGSPFPAPWIIARALELGIPLSPGSDAHLPREVGRHFDRLAAHIAPLHTSPAASAQTAQR